MTTTACNMASWRAGLRARDQASTFVAPDSHGFRMPARQPPVLDQKAGLEGTRVMTHERGGRCTIRTEPETLLHT